MAGALVVLLRQATLRRLDKAFTAFFRRVKAGEKPGYPRFKGAGRFDTVEFPKDGDGCRWDSTPHDPVTRVRLQGVGHVRVHRHRPVRGRVKTVSVKREGRKWYVILACDGIPAGPLPATGRASASTWERCTSPPPVTASTSKTPAFSGRRLIPVDSRNTSRECPECGHTAKENRPTQAKFTCVACGFTADADHVGALNVLNRAGLVLCDAAWPATQEAHRFGGGRSHGSP